MLTTSTPLSKEDSMATLCQAQAPTGWFSLILPQQRPRQLPAAQAGYRSELKNRMATTVPAMSTGTMDTRYRKP